MNNDPESLSTPASAQALDKATTQALEGEELRSDDWKRLARALEGRRERIERDLHEADTPRERDELEAKLEELDEHVRVLNEEADISRFVEDTVKFSYEVRRLSEG